MAAEKALYIIEDQAILRLVFQQQLEGLRPVYLFEDWRSAIRESEQYAYYSPFGIVLPFCETLLPESLAEVNKQHQALRRHFPDALIWASGLFPMMPRKREKVAQMGFDGCLEKPTLDGQLVEELWNKPSGCA